MPDVVSEPPVVLVAGPGDTVSWDVQHHALRAAGHRVVTHASRPAGIDALVAGLAELLERPDLAGCVLAGLSIGTATVSRYLSTYGSRRVRKAVLLSTVLPYLPPAGDNPDGLDATGFARVRDVLAGDSAAIGEVLGTDFRADLPRIDVPVLLLHGEADRVLPIDATAHRLPGMIPDLRYEVIADGPHDLGRAAPDLVDRYLVEFVSS